MFQHRSVWGRPHVTGHCLPIQEVSYSFIYANFRPKNVCLGLIRPKVSFNDCLGSIYAQDTVLNSTWSNSVMSVTAQVFKFSFSSFKNVINLLGKKGTF